jgi:signal transduction histidine kinase
MILIVDDDPNIRALLRRILERHEYRCVEAKGAAQAREALQQNNDWELVISDVNMPGETGISLLRHVRAVHPDLPIVMVSGIGDPYLAAAAIDYGAYGYVTKPFDSNQVLIAVANALRRARLESENRAYQGQLEARVAERTAALADALHSLQVSDERRRRLMARLVDAQEEERRRIAGDVHDDAVQVMTAVNFRLEVLRRGLSDPEQAAAALKLEESVALSISRLRGLLFDLSPPALSTGGLGAALRAYLEQQGKDWGMEWDLVEQLGEQPPEAVRTLLYRVAQEALINVRKHAGECLVVVRIGERDGGVLLEVSDTGQGCDPGVLAIAEAGHLGLSGMRERASLAGGWCTVSSAVGRGTVVEVWVPTVPLAVATPS